MKQPIFITIALIGFLVFSGENKTITVSSNEIGKVNYAGFSLSEPGLIHLKGKAGKTLQFAEKGIVHVYYGWILERQSRKLVWNAFNAQSKKSDNPSRQLIQFDEDLFLPNGDYEIYYIGIKSSAFMAKWKSRLSIVLPTLLQEVNEEDFKNMRLSVSGPVGNFKAQKVQKDKLIPNAVVSISNVGDHKTLTKSFEVEEETRLGIYAIGEGVRRDGGIYDYGWIIDVDKRKRIWTMTVRDSTCAGGHEKNILVQDTINLPKGTYELHFVSDGTHSSKEWNASPPNDPLSWGITLSATSPELMEHISHVKTVQRHAPFLQMVQVGNDKFVARGFQTKKDLTVRVLCIGERDNSDTMADFGWIIDTETGEKIWTMTYKQSQHAGGSYKNRMADDFIPLTKGTYIAFYKTDDSHAFDNWNAAPPFKGENWGMTLWTREKEDYKSIVLFNMKDYERKSIIKKIVRPGNHQFIEKTIMLKEDTPIRILALGEGTPGSDLSDFGWLENEDTGRVVWTMSMEKTHHAGGNEKNREQTDIITLKAGSYKLCYETDSSHAYGKWNADPPDYQERYGIIIFRHRLTEGE